MTWSWQAGRSMQSHDWPIFWIVLGGMESTPLRTGSCPESRIACPTSWRTTAFDFVMAPRVLNVLRRYK